MEHKTYGTGFAITVTPPDRADDVLHYLITGTLSGGRSLEGVTWEDCPDSVVARRDEALAMSLAKQ